MDFGRVELSQLDGIPFKLPREPYSNSTVLRGAKPKHPKFFVGFSSWGRKEWIGKLYPKGTKDKDFQTEYVKHFNAIEFNATHYKLSSEEDINRWLARAQGIPFLFCPKVYNGISHFGSFNDKQFLTEVFLKNIHLFGKQLGPVFLQLSDKFGPKRKEELFNYLKTLPKNLTFFLEVRHPDWFTQTQSDELFEKLKELGIGAVITDTAGRRDVAHMHLTIPKTMVRFVANGNHPSDEKRLDEWVSRIKYWAEEGLEELYFFIHCLDESFAPHLAQYFIHELNEKCEAGLKEIQLLDQA